MHLAGFQIQRSGIRHTININNKMEIWKDIIGYEGLYQVSACGKVRSVRREIILKQCKQTHGYYIVGLYAKNGLQKCPLIHRLVALHFILNPQNKSEVNHINGIKTDNRVENLEWLTRPENAAHAAANNLYSFGGRAKLNPDLIIKIRHQHNYGISQVQLARLFNVTQDSIFKIVHRKTWKQVV